MRWIVLLLMIPFILLGMLLDIIKVGLSVGMILMETWITNWNLPRVETPSAEILDFPPHDTE